MPPTLSPFKTDFKVSYSSFLLDDLYNIISRSAYRLHVLMFHICLYNFLFFANHSQFLGELRFENNALLESLDHGNVVKLP